MWFSLCCVTCPESWQEGAPQSQTKSETWRNCSDARDRPTKFPDFPSHSLSRNSLWNFFSSNSWLTFRIGRWIKLGVHIPSCGPHNCVFTFCSQAKACWISQRVCVCLSLFVPFFPYMLHILSYYFFLQSQHKSTSSCKNSNWVGVSLL